MEESRRQQMLNIHISKNYLVEKPEAEGLKILRISSSINWHFFLFLFYFI